MMNMILCGKNWDISELDESASYIKKVHLTV